MSRRKAATSRTVRSKEPKRAKQPRRAAPSTSPRVLASEQRPKRARRAPHRWTRWTLAIGVLVTVLAFATQWLLHQSIFRVQHVTFVGLRHETSTAVLAASGLASHPTMLSVNDAQIMANLSSFTWINTLSIAKHWPNSVVVTVHESVAVAVAYTNNHVLEFVDRNGRALGPAPVNENLPTLEYLFAKNSSWPYQSHGRGAAYVASQLPLAFGAQVSRITEDSSGTVILKMTTPLTFILGPTTQLHAKFVAIASVIAHSTLVPGDVVDVTVPDELAVTPPGSS